MLISHKHKFIFIHNYKVGGSSISSGLKSRAIYNPPKNTNLTEIIEQIHLQQLVNIDTKQINQFINLILPRFDKHVKAVQIKNKLGEEIWQDYFKFGFVRNPWDRQVSLYYHMLKHKVHRQHTLIKNMSSFEKYIDWRVKNDKHLQKEFFYDENNNCIVDFIGKLENIEEDFAQICNKIGINAKLPHKNKTSHKPYQHYYNQQTKNLIAKGFKKDIELFNYEF